MTRKIFVWLIIYLLPISLNFNKLVKLSILKILTENLWIRIENYQNLKILILTAEI